MGDINSRYYVGKTVQINYDEIIAQADETCLFCLTRAQQMAIIAILEPLGWTKRWYSPTGVAITKDFVEDFLAQAEARIMTDVCQDILDKLNTIETKINNLQTDLDISQAGQDVALAGILSELTGIVEPSIAGLAAAIAGVSLQVSGVQGTSDEIDEDVDNIELLVQKMKNSVTNIVNNTIINIGFNLPDQTFTSDSTDVTLMQTYARYNALCEAIVQWIIAEGYAMMDILGATPTDLATLAASLEAYSLSFAYVMTPGAQPYDITTLLGAFSDSSAVNDVACAMINQLANLPADYGNFASALAAYTPPALPDARHVIYDTLLITFFDLNSFETFQGILKQSYDVALAAAPTAFNCPACGTFTGFCGIPQSWDFTIMQKTPWLIQRGIMTAGSGIVGEQIPGDLSFGIDISISFDPPCTAINNHHCNISHAMQSAGGNAWTVEFYYMVAGIETLYSQSNFSQTTNWPTVEVGTLTLNNPPGGVTVGISRIRFYANTAYYGNATSHASSAATIPLIEFVT